MRKLNTNDFRVAIKFAARHKDELFPLLFNKDVEKLLNDESQKENFGQMLLSLLLCDDGVDDMFNVIESIAEKSPIPLDELPDVLKEIAKENDMKGFFTRLLSALSLGASRTNAATDTAGQ